jgi:hypothetical protein
LQHPIYLDEVMNLEELNEFLILQLLQLLLLHAEALLFWNFLNGDSSTRGTLGCAELGQSGRSDYIAMCCTLGSEYFNEGGLPEGNRLGRLVIMNYVVFRFLTQQLHLIETLSVLTINQLKRKLLLRGSSLRCVGFSFVTNWKAIKNVIFVLLVLSVDDGKVLPYGLN